MSDEIEYHYYLKMDLKKIKTVHRGLDNLYSYVIGIMHKNMDDKHGPTNPLGEWADDVHTSLIPLKNAFDQDKHKLINLGNHSKAAKKKLVDMIIESIKSSNPDDELDLIRRLITAINNFEIIGVNKNFNGQDFKESDDILPF